ncbi:MAG: fluoride efflux transporter CrcB [Pirellulales bacterium]
MGISLTAVTRALLVFLGAGSGGLLRYWLGGLVQHWWGPSFPLGTLLVNVSGCLAMGFLATAWTGSAPVREEHRMLVLIGFLGGYTTFSSFGYETLILAHRGDWGRMALYVMGSVGLCLFAVWIGAFLATKLYGPYTS